MATIFGTVALKMYEVAYGQFGVIFMQDLYEKQGNSVEDTESLLVYSGLM